MTSILYLVLLGCTAVMLPPFLIVTKKLSQKESALLGLVPALISACLSYAALVVGAVVGGAKAAIVSLLLTQPTPLLTFLLYCKLRAKRHKKLLEAFKALKKSERPAIHTTAKMRRLLKGFEIRSPLPVEAQHEIVILLSNKTDPETIKKFYNCRESDLTAIKRAFDLHVERNTPAPKGEDYEILPEQREFLLRLMLTATPSGLGLGEGLLWDNDSIARLIGKANGKRPSHESILRFLDASGILLKNEHYAFADSPEARLWEKTQYEKIRLAALEKEVALVWLYALPLPAIACTALVAVTPDSPILYGIYKENSGLSDFLNKLGSHRIFAVVTFNKAPFKKFNGPPANITLFTYGERPDIPTK